MTGSHRWTTAKAALLAAGLLLVLPAMASAADRYAEPAGDGAEPCAQTDPCPMNVAIDGSSNGDDVTLLGGTYTYTGPSLGTSRFGITVHGSPGAPPVLNLTTTGGTGITLRTGSTLRDVIVNSSAAGNLNSAVSAFGATVERVVAHEAGTDGRACGLGSGTTVRDTVCWNSGAGGANASAVGVFGQFSGDTATLRNVTAVSTASYGIRVVGFGGNSIAVTATNVIAKGGGVAGQEDVHTSLTSGGTAATVTLDHSNYTTESEQNSGDITDPGSATNVTTAPLFVNAGTGDFHQQATSTGTLNLGTATGQDPLELDFDGQERAMGSAPDIGADELAELPPAPTITGSDPPSGSNENNPLLIGSAAPFSLVHLFASSDCTGPDAGTAVAEEFATPGIGVSVPDNLTTTFSANAVNDAGTSDCSDPFEYTEVTPSPPVTTPPTSVAPTPVPKKKCKKKKHRAAAAKKCKKKKK